jgi:hypothetical protein
MTRTRACFVIVVATAMLGIVESAAAAPIRECGQGVGGSYGNLTTRNVSCSTARGIASRVMHDVRACWPSERQLGGCNYRVGVWSVRGRWFHDRLGLDQLDLRAGASGGRVVRFQTDWDDE